LVKIRLKRMGAKKRPFYRLVVADARSPRDGKFIEELGTYDPIAQPARVKIDADRVREWMRKGAQPTDTARKLLEMESILPRSARPVRPAKPVAEANGATAAAATRAAAAPPAADDAVAEAAAPAVDAESSPAQDPAEGADEGAVEASVASAEAAEAAEEA
jgi:small subunit ribosomal protein S16